MNETKRGIVDLNEIPTEADILTRSDVIKRQEASYQRLGEAYAKHLDGALAPLEQGTMEILNRWLGSGTRSPR